MVFDTNWFIEKQNILLWLLNCRLTKRWFRYVMRIMPCDCELSTPINMILPDSFSYGGKFVDNKLEVTTDFRTHNKYAKRLYYAFKPFWYLIHLFDTKFANEVMPALNMGFDTLTVYPDASSGGDSCDGTIEYYGGSAGVTWSTITSAESGTTVRKTDTNLRVLYGRAGTTANQYSYLTRGFFSFKTSTIGTGKQINSATISFYCNSKYRNSATWANVTANVFASTQTNANDLATGDYSKVGNTAFSTAKSYDSWVVTPEYNNYSFNATGKSAIVVDGVSKFSVREGYYDAAGNSPGYQSGDEYYLNCYFADETGTSRDPKLVVNYSIPSGPANLKSYNTNLKANIKSINTNLIANVKTYNTQT